MESIGYYHFYIKIIMMCNGVSNLNVSSAFPYKIITEISSRFLNLGGQNPARFLNLGGRNPAEICRNLGGQNPAEILKSRRPKYCRDRMECRFNFSKFIEFN